MEKWPKQHITSILYELIQRTQVNSTFLVYFQSQKILICEEIERIESSLTNAERAKQFYNLLETKLDGYKFLLHALQKTNQSGALKTIWSSAPRIFLENVKVVIGTEEKLLSTILNPEEMKIILKWIRSQKGAEILNILLNTKSPVKLLKSNIPPPDPFYIPRLLSRRVDIDPKVFNADTEEIFVFRNITRMALREFVGTSVIGFSSEQLVNIKCRHILLDRDKINHWNEIRKKAKKPAHLVYFRSDDKKFSLQQTTGDSKVLQNSLNRRTEQKHISEDSLISDDSTVDRGLCICDSPGMGKSLLLANIARRAQIKYPNRLVSFVQLSDLAQLINEQNILSMDIVKAKPILVHLFTEPPLNRKLLETLLNSRSQLVKLELFFDGLDEVKADKMEIVSNFLLTVLDNMANARIYATSRGHVRKQLESATRFIAYDIVPFDEENQANYLVSYWHTQHPESDKTSLYNFAQRCFESCKQNLRHRERSLLGIPLQCRIFADIYSELARIYCLIDNDKKVDDSYFVTNIWQMFDKFLTKRLQPTDCNYQCMLKADSVWFKKGFRHRCAETCNIRSFHTLLALAVIFPNFFAENCNHISRLTGLSTTTVLKPGVVVIGTREGTYKFIHRTFAEYLCAEFFHSQLLVFMKRKRGNIQLAKLAVKFLLTKVLETDTKPHYTTDVDVRLSCTPYRCEVGFRNPMVVYFFENIAAASKMCASMHQIKVDFVGQTLFGCLKGLHAAIKFNYLNLVGVYLTFFPTQLSMVATNSFQQRQLLNTAILYGSVSNINFIIRMCWVVAKIDLLKACSYTAPKEFSALDISIKSADYEKVCFCLERTYMSNRKLIYHLIVDTYMEDDEIMEIRKEICELLLQKLPTFRNELQAAFNPHYFPARVSLDFVIYILKQGANIRVTNTSSNNIAGYAASYMSAPDFHKLTEFIIYEKKVPQLFSHSRKWHSPLRNALRNVKDLKLETLKLIFSSTKVNVNGVYKECHGQSWSYSYNLIQCAIKGKQSPDVVSFLKKYEV